eukprot:m.82348 g.82348  ORF g.82348 m.82348 type:complete len:575 (-) comp25509_c0_seq3:599-2323(-)
MTFRVAVSVSLALACGAGCPKNFHACKGQELVYPPNIDMTSLPNHNLDLSLVPFLYDGYAATFMTRAFATPNHVPSIPGPTLRIQKGQSFSITLRNRLGKNDPDGTTTENSFRSPNTTNLHTHGLHMSPTSPSDNVLVTVEPQTNRTYEYDIPSGHMPGTHWYHPHYHGSSALQVGGGAAGAIVIEDTPNDVPQELFHTPDRVMLFQNFYMAPDDTSGVVNISGVTLDKLVHPTYTRSANAGVEDMDDSWWTINGCYEPKITLERHQSVRWRLISASINQVLELTLPGCTFALLAKDGVFVTPTPRAVSVVYLSPASRADVIVTCDRLGNFFLHSEDVTDVPEPPPRHRPGSGFPSVGQLATIVVVPSQGPPSPIIPRFRPQLPNYLADLQFLPPAIMNQRQLWNVSLNGPNAINAITYEPGVPQTSFTTGGVVEWNVNHGNPNGAQRHPMHMHVWHFQIVDLPLSTTPPDYFQIGDFHDTIQVGLELATADEMTIRFQTGRYNGTVVLHCHILSHEDQGMMTTFNVVGKPATELIKSQHPVCRIAATGEPCCPFRPARCEQPNTPMYRNTTNH